MVRLNKSLSEIGKAHFKFPGMNAIAKMFSRVEIKPKLCEYCHKDIRHGGYITRAISEYGSPACRARAAYRRKLKRKGKKITQPKKGIRRAGLI